MTTDSKTKAHKGKATKPATLASQWPQLKGYNPKASGPVPTGAQLGQAMGLGYRQGASNTFAVAMAMRPKGSTTPQVSGPCGGPQLNVLRAMAAGKSRNGTKVKLSQTKDGKLACYHVTLPAKASAKAPAKGKATPKAARKETKAAPEAAQAPAAQQGEANAPAG